MLTHMGMEHVLGQPHHSICANAKCGLSMIDEFLVLFLVYLFILFIYDKGPESATDMPMIVNSKLTHYKIRQISTDK